MRKGMLIAGLILVLTLLGADDRAIAPGQELPVQPVMQPEPAQKAKPRIEVVFVLDTTGSMGGLIQAAKEKIWAITNSLTCTRPAPEIRIGLVAYRDRGDAYVTRVTPLSDDLDAVYKDLMQLQAQGGGDTPESVNQALHEAVTHIKWNTDSKTYQVIFLVGDCPPHMDYKDDVKYEQTCIQAAKAGIIINTIQCGRHQATQPVWGDIAKRAEGNYFRVEQSGSAILAATPFDTELAALSRELDETRVFYGASEVRAKEEKRAEESEQIYAKAPASALATRAEFNAGQAGKANFSGANDLIEEVEQGAVKLETVKAEDLPPVMQKMDAKQREAFVRTNIEHRRDIQQKIKKLAADRQAHIRKEMAQKGKAREDSLEAQIFDTVRTQAADKGIEYTEDVSY